MAAPWPISSSTNTSQLPESRFDPNRCLLTEALQRLQQRELLILGAALSRSRHWPVLIRTAAAKCSADFRAIDFRNMRRDSFECFPPGSVHDKRPYLAEWRSSM